MNELKDKVYDLNWDKFKASFLKLYCKDYKQGDF